MNIEIHLVEQWSGDQNGLVEHRGFGVCAG